MRPPLPAYTTIITQSFSDVYVLVAPRSAAYIPASFKSGRTRNDLGSSRDQIHQAPPTHARQHELCLELLVVLVGTSFAVQVYF